MEKMLFLIILYLFCYSNANAQYFNIEYGEPYNQEEACIGKAYEYKGNYVSLISLSKPSIKTSYEIILISKFGDYIKSFPIQDDSASISCLDWTQAKDGNFYIITKEEKSKDIFSLYLLKLDDNLQIETKTMLNWDYTYPFKINLKGLENGNLAIFGSAGNSFIQYDSYAIYYEINPLGEQIWKVANSYGFASSTFNDITYDDKDNSYFLTSSYNPKFMTSTIYLYKYSSSHNKIFEKSYSANAYYFNQIQVNKKGNILFFGGKLTTGKHQGKLVISIKDNKGNDVSAKQYFNYESRPLNCVQDENGSFTCSGSVYEDSLFNGGFIFKFSESGDSLWSRIYAPYKSNTHNLNKINPTSEGGYILTGSLNSPSDSSQINNKQAWIINVDSLGYDHTTLWPDTIQSLGYEPNLPKFIFCPNPSIGEVHFAWWNIPPKLRENFTVEIYNMNGVLVKVALLNLANSTINLQLLTPGIYPFIIKDENGIIINKDKLVLINSNK